MNRVEYIRNKEKEYHDACYDNYKLFEKGSWLYKPVKTVMEQLPYFKEKTNIRVLDLGSGVGRNSIPIAKEIKGRGKVVCVDLLLSATEKLKQYSKEYDVEEVIKLETGDIEDYSIKKERFDFIIAVSALEHVASEAVFNKVIESMAQGTKKNGINCIIVNSEVEEIDIEKNKKLDVMMEVNIKTEEMLHKLDRLYDGWEVRKRLVKPLKYTIERDDRDALLQTNAITYVVTRRF
ncbi:class I SAM-dependent methyltransferase [Oceanobacillus sojae]|uniref:class I SAM-dependent methyltransferase n=1 Tax=Oceanobacillus sojae TaxID=582851 RepID=UPI0009883ED3|nr:class I SAM-dependent methyltransferase [Oceanobacillus sojae]MCT1904607.1 class I SAM-dependent methyltransferase [Oceanobacillus sojae]